MHTPPKPERDDPMFYEWAIAQAIHNLTQFAAAEGWAEDEHLDAQLNMWSYMRGPVQENGGERCTVESRKRFARACVVHNLTGLPGQASDWYEEVEIGEQQLLAELTTAPVS